MITLETALQYMTYQECWNLNQWYKPSRMEQNRHDSPFNVFRRITQHKSEIQNRLNTYVSRETFYARIGFPLGCEKPCLFINRTDIAVASRWIAGKWLQFKKWSTTL